MMGVARRTRVLTTFGVVGACLLGYVLGATVLVYGVLAVASALLFGTVPTARVGLVVALLTVGAGGLLCVWALRRGPALVLSAVDAPLHEVPDDTRLASRLEDHATSRGVTPPNLKLAATDQPLAVTVGVRQETTTMVVSQGLIDLLPVAELDAVLIHELAHVERRDTQVLTVLSIPIVIARRCHTIGTGYWRGDEPADEHGTGSTDHDRYVGPFSASVLVVLFALCYPLAAVGRVLIGRRSAGRNLAADRAAAATTGTDPVVNAIARIEDKRAETPLEDSLASSVLAPFAFVPAASYGPDGSERQDDATRESVPTGTHRLASGYAPDTELRRRTLETSRE